MVRNAAFGFVWAAAWVTCLAWAQPPAPPGPGGFAGPPGGFGANPLGLLTMPEVRKELGTNDRQNKQLDELAGDLQRRTRAAFDKINFQELPSLSPEEREKRFAEARKQSEEAGREADKKLDGILDEKQLARFRQLRLQREGAAALGRADVAEKLGLTEEQRRKVRKIQDDNRGPGAGERALADAVAVLTDAQKATWQQMRGAEFKFPPPSFGGFGPMGMQQRKIVKQFDRDGDGRLNAAERRAARESLKKERAAGGGRGGFGRPGGFAPGEFLTRPLMQALDADQDGKVTKDELAAGVKKFFAQADAERKGSLKEGQLAETINGLLPRPPGMPGGGPPGGPRGFGPGTFVAGTLVRRADADKDGTVTLAELTAAAAAWFKEADKDHDGQLDDKELGAAVAALMPGPGGGRSEPGRPGPRVAPADVKFYPDAGLYEPSVLRTLFLGFEEKDWEAELEEFHGTDVEVPAVLTVDGKKYPGVGAHFRGMSSYMGVRAGSKRSFSLSLDFVDPKQRLYGYKSLNLLNSHDDPAMMSTVLYSHVARQYVPAPKANFVKLVVNGESWGVYVNVQQFNKDFLRDHYRTTKGARWKVRGSPGGGGGLDYLGDDLEAYRRRYEIKSADDPKAWQALIELCKTLSKTPPERLEEALAPILDLDGLLWFLALDAALINNDGYWIRASDYSLYRDPKGKFHVIPHDMNEAFRPAGGPGFGPPGAGRSSVELDPLVGLDDARKPLRSKVLAVPSLRRRYLQHVRTIADDWLDWRKLGPVVAGYRSLIEKEVEADTRKLDSFAEFRRLTADEEQAAPADRPGRPSLGLRAFAEQRRKYLLEHPEVRKAAAPSEPRPLGSRRTPLLPNGRGSDGALRRAISTCRRRTERPVGLTSPHAPAARMSITSSVAAPLFAPRRPAGGHSRPPAGPCVFAPGPPRIGGFALMASILVIDDDRVIRTFARVVLEGAGHHVLDAADGAEGLALYERGGVDLIVCDLFMPEKDGLETIRAARRHRPGARIIAMSAGACAGKLDMLPTAQRLGAAATLRKPFSPGALLGLVEDLLRDAG